MNFEVKMGWGWGMGVGALQPLSNLRPAFSNIKV